MYTWLIFYKYIYFLYSYNGMNTFDFITLIECKYYIIDHLT